MSQVVKSLHLLLPLIVYFCLLIVPAGVNAQTQPSGETIRTVAITFDDLPVASEKTDIHYQQAITDQLVQIIRNRRIPVIGFVNEFKLYRDDKLDSTRVLLLRRWVDAGIDLGNHTYSHPSLHQSTLTEFQDDVLRGEIVTRKLLEGAGKSPKYFRHPFLHTGRDLAVRDSLNTFLNTQGYQVAPVTIDNSDWIFARAYELAYDKADTLAAKRIAETYIPYMESRFAYYEQQSQALFGYEIPQVLLLHSSLINAHTLDRMIDFILRRGYRIVPLDDVLVDQAYRAPDTYTGPGGISWIHRWALSAGHRGDFFKGEPRTPASVMEAAGVDSE